MIQFFLGLLKDLIHGDNQARCNAAVLLITCGVLSVATVLLTLAIIFSKKNLIAEFGTAVGALTGLSGHAYYTAKKFGQPEVQPTPPEDPPK